MLKTIFILALLSLLQTFAATLVWDSNTETNLAGYRVYDTEPSGKVTITDTGLRPNFPLAELTPGVNHTFYVTAYNTDEIESDPSDSVSYFAPAGVPPLVEITSHQFRKTGTNVLASIAWNPSPPEFGVSSYQLRVMQAGQLFWRGSTTATNWSISLPDVSPTIIALWATNSLGASDAVLLPYEKPARPGHAKINP